MEPSNQPEKTEALSPMEALRRATADLLDATRILHDAAAAAYVAMHEGVGDRKLAGLLSTVEREGGKIDLLLLDFGEAVREVLKKKGS